MKLRLAAAACILALVSCGRDVQRPSGTTASANPSSPDVPLVHVNGYAIDVNGPAPAVPVALEAAGDAVAPTQLPAVSPRLRALATPAGADARSAVRDARDAKAAKRTKWIVQFTGPIRDEDRAQLAELVTAVGDYLPDFAFVVSMDDAARARVQELPFVRGVARFRPAYKISRALKDEAGDVRVEPGEAARVRVRVDAADGLPAFLSSVHGGKGKVLHAAKDVAQVEVAQADLARLARLEEVLWIEPAVPMQLVNDTSRWTIQSYVPASTPMSDRGLDGAGQLVGIGDSGVDADMCYFADPAGAPFGATHRKIAGYDPTYGDDWDEASHGTHVSGTVAGDQAPVTGGTAANGMAPRARIFMSDLTPGNSIYVFPPDDLGMMFRMPYEAGARIHTNSWGAGYNFYDVMAWSADRFMWEHPDFLVLFANGNSGPYQLRVGMPATAKNIVSVGATENGTSAENLASFSSWGPAWDGRLKPTLSAPGVAIASAAADGLRDSANCGTVAFSGTSMATPTVAGAAALVRQYYLDGFWPSGLANPTDAFAPSAALVKATLVNAAQPMVGDLSGGPIPSIGQGWGRINLSNALRFAGDAKYLDVADVRGGIETGSTWTKQFYALGGMPVKVTLVWTDYPGAQYAEKELVNDLDLEIVTPDGNTYLGNVFDQGASITGGAADRLNVEEQVYLPTSVRGNYTVRVRGYNVPNGPQPFALVITGAGGIGPLGFVGLDRGRYGASTTIEVKVGDRGLNASPTVADEAFVTIRSGADPIGESVRLVEVGLDTSVFLGTISTGHAPGVPGDGILAVAEGDTITAIYEDADDGTGAPATTTATAVGDLTAPVISGVTVTALGQGAATIVWTTSEPATAAVLYGKTQALGARASRPWLDVTHAVVVGALEEGTAYLYAVEATDEAGNVARDDGGGAPRSFTTLVLPPDVTAYSSRGDTTYEVDTVVFGKALDPSGVASLTVNGATVPVRPADGYYETTVPLAVGQNVITVVARDVPGLTGTTQLTVTRLPRPDLTVSWVTAPESAGLGVAFEAQTQICNIGTGDQTAEYIRVLWFLYEDDVPGQAPIAVLLKDERLYTMLGAGVCTSHRRGLFANSPSYLGRRFHVGAAAIISESEDNDSNNDNITSTLISFEPPDLILTAMSAPDQVGTAVPFDANVTVANVGVGAVGPYPLVHVYLSTDDAITTADRLVAVHGPVQVQGPGQSVATTIPVTLPSDLPAGTYWLGAIVDVGNDIVEGVETNNSLAGPTVTVAGPDLQGTTVTAPPSALTGATITVHDVVTAAAGGGASGFRVGIYVSPDPTVTKADPLLATRTVTGLAPGAASSGDTVIAIPTTWGTGTYYVGAIADDVNVIVETSEANNIASAAIEIVGPDLAVTSLLVPGSALVGGTIVVEDTVVASPAGGSAPATAVGFYLSADPVITTTDRLVGWRDLPALAPGGASVGTTTIAVPHDVPPGTYYLGAIADDFTLCWEDEWETVTCVGGDVARELDTANNARAGGPIVVAGTDLLVTEVSAPASGATGTPLVVHDTVAAVGGGAGGFRIAYYLSADAAITTADKLLGYRSVGGLAPGASSTADTTFTVPVGLVPGPYYVGAIADRDGGVAETDETNNARSGNTVEIAGADWGLSSISGPASAAAGVAFDVSVTIANAGPGASPSTTVSIRRSPDAAITTGDERLTYANVGSIPPGGSTVVTLSVTIGSHVAPGTYHLGATIDDHNQLREPDEANNALDGGLLTLGSPDLEVTAIAGPASAPTGGTIAVSYAVVAAATGAVAGSSTVSFYLSLDAEVTSSDVLLGSVSLPALASGATTSGTVGLAVPTTLPGGTYQLGAIVDPWSSVQETNESNNALAGNAIAITGPDLVATAVSGPATATRGSAIAVSNTVVASADGGATPAFYVGIYLSTDSTITAADVLLGYRQVGAMQPGASSSDATAVTVPASLAPGTYYVGMLADNFAAACEWDWGLDAEVCTIDQAKELDEMNNGLAGGTIAITAP